MGVRVCEGLWGKGRGGGRWLVEEIMVVVVGLALVVVLGMVAALVVVLGVVVEVEDRVVVEVLEGVV